ncbi:MAG: PAS domain-containing sensor histidine kinase [Anaerolineae bacterium]|nr:PAS domain-containing sensor histidine kinase [Anaerolineae bacterium]
MSTLRYAVSQLTPELRVSMIYTFAALIWILLSDRLLELLVGPDPAMMGLLQSVKGILFISVTGGIFYIVLRREFSARRETEEKLVLSEEKFRYLFMHNPLPMWVYDLHTLRFLDVNATAVAQYGYSRSEFLSMRITDIRPEADIPHLLRNIEQQRPTLQFSGEWRHRYKNGEIATVEIISHELEFSGHHGVLVVANNITERKRLEAELREQQTLHLALKKENEVRGVQGRFVSMLSHEFRNPLAGIRTASDLMDRYYDRMTDEQRHGYCERINTEVDNLNKMVEDILTLLRSDEMGPEFNPEPLDVLAFCEDIVRKWLNVTDRVRFQMESVDQPIVVEADEKLLRYAITNLVSNAVKYSPPEQPVKVVISKDDQHVKIAVRDKGVGILPENMDQLFEPFFRGKNVGNVPGNGLGLAIAKQSVDLHGGSLSVTSEVGVGSEFVIDLPQKQRE